MDYHMFVYGMSRITKNFVRYLKWEESERTLFSAILGVGKLPYMSRIRIQLMSGDTVDGWNPAPPGM